MKPMRGLRESASRGFYVRGYAVVESLKPARGGFPLSLGCGWFVREFLLGRGSNGSPKINPDVGTP